MLPPIRSNGAARQLALWVVLASFALVAPAAAQEPATPVEAPPVEPPPPAIEVVRVAEIGVQAAEVTTRLAEIEKALAPSEVVDEVTAAIPDLEESYEQKHANMDDLLDDAMSRVGLENLAREWAEFESELDAYQDTLGDRAAQIESQLERLREERERWQATRQAAVEAEAPEEVLAPIGEVEARLSTVGDIARERQGAIATLQARVATLRESVRASGSLVADAQQAAVGDIFVADRPALWHPELLERLSGDEIWNRILEAEAKEIEIASAFIDRRERAIRLHLAFFVALSVGLLMARRKVRAASDTDEGLATVRGVFERPFSMALLLTILVAVWTLPNMPRALSHVLGLVLLLPAVLILHRLIERPFFPILNAMILFQLTDRIRLVLAPLPQAPRIILLLEMLGFIALLLWWRRPSRLSKVTPQVAASFRVRVLALATRLSIWLCGISLLSNAAGYTRLAEILGGGVLFGAYVGVVLYGAYRVLDGLVTFALRVRPLRLFGMVQRHRYVIRSRVMNVAQLLMTVWFGSLVLERLTLSDDVWAAMVAFAEADLALGELEISIGGVLLFALTIWVAYQVSKFIRFFLEEDVYTRVPLKKGQPYAVSTLTHYTVLTLGFIVALAALGIDLDRFALVAGAFSVGIGFGMQNIVNNFVSGLILLTERPVEVGDTVAMGEVFGEVQRIGIRSSTVRTWQGAEVIVPNGSLVSEQVINWTHSDKRRRFEIPVGVAYGTDVQLVMSTLMAVAEANEDVLADPAPYVLFLGFGDSSLDFELRAHTDNFEGFLGVRSAAVVAIEAAFSEAGITIPFPQRDLHVQSGADPAAGSPSADRSSPD